MPCEPVTSGPPAKPSSTNSSTSSLAFRMKRVDSGGGGARRALTALGTNDTKLNLRLAKSLLTISQDKFAKKWNFDPVMEVPISQGRFSWTPTTSDSISPSVINVPSHDLSPSYRLLSGLTSSVSSSSGPRAAVVAASHDLAAAATTEAEDNAAALRTCLNLPLEPSDGGAIQAKLTPNTGAPHQEPRVPPIHPEEPTACTVGPRTSCIGEPLSTTYVASREPTFVDNERDADTHLDPTSAPPHSSTVVPSISPSSSSIVAVGDASDMPPSVDSEGGGAEASEDNQCQKIDPSLSTSSSSTDDRRQQAMGPQAQTCITNYLNPRKRSSAHLKETVHPSKTKKVMLAA